MEVYVPIIGKIIGKTIVTSMAITKKDEFGILIKWNRHRVFVGSI